MSLRSIEIVDDRDNPRSEEPVILELSRGVRGLATQARRADGDQDPADGLMATPALWQSAAFEGSDLDFESKAFDCVDVSGDGDSSDWLRPRIPGLDADWSESDYTPMPADPVFKERLREKLWAMISGSADAGEQLEAGPIGSGPRSPRPGLNSKRPR